jgi:hypothetical protein
MVKIPSFVRRAKELYSWYSFAVGTAALFVTGFGLAVGCAVWLIKIGIPLPLALMAGYCTLVGAVYLAMAPAVFRLVFNAPISKRIEQKNQLPNYEAWKHVGTMTLAQASHLWCDIDPDLPDTLDTSAWLKALAFAWRKGDLIVAHREGTPAMVTRDALKLFAKKHGYDPRFLRDN